jgi:UDP-N-acetylglucosamine 3-dehydrogenase
MNVAIVGLGNMGKNYLRVCSEINYLNIVGISDVNNKFKEEYKKIFFSNYQDLLKVNPDFVCIVTPTFSHFQIAKFFIENNVNVLIEKPACSTIEEVNELIKLTENSKSKVMVGHIENFNPVVSKMFELIHDGVLGNIINFTFKRIGLFPPRVNDSIILDLGIHDYQLCTKFGDIKSIYTIGGHIFKNEEDYSLSVLKYNNGINGTVENSWLTPYKIRKINIVGTKSVLDADLLNGTIFVENGNFKSEYKIEKKESLKLEIEHFINCIICDENPIIDLYVGRKALNLSLKSMESCREDKIINI